MPEFFTVAGIILAVIVLFVICVISLRGTLTVAYDGEFSLSFRALFIKIKILPTKEKTKRYRKTMSRGRARRIRRSVSRKDEKRRALKERFFGKKKEKKAEAPKEKAEKKQGPDIPASMIAREVIDIVSVFTEVIAILVKRFTHHLHIKIARLKVTVATEDPSVTAVTYGAVSQIINVLLPILSSVENLGLPKKKDLDISVDFNSTVPDIDLEVSFSLRTWHVADIALRSLFGATSKYVGRRGGVDKTIEHISDIIKRLSPTDGNNEENETEKENKK